ncbi:MAG: 4Fe-4S dicluster domain-containing protein [Chloroflexota bacterium]
MIGILIDVTRCVGCFQCVDACVEANQLGADVPAPQDVADGLSARRFSTIIEQPSGHYVRKQCRHCLEPACVSVCPVAAMQKTPDGPVIYDSSRCMGCRYCMMACPYGIPRYEWDSLAPVVRKCNLCYERLQAGQSPACVEACPQQALLFGEREQLLAEARLRLEANPDLYVHHIYGEQEVGGTSVLYVSDVPLDFLGYEGSPSPQPLPALTQSAMNMIPSVATGVMALMAGTYWIIERRMKLMGRPDVPPPAEAAEQNNDA